jgi:hypothetical protein
MGGVCITHGRKEKYKNVVGEAAWMRQFRRPMSVSENNIKLDIKEVGYEDMD